MERQDAPRSGQRDISIVKVPDAWGKWVAEINIPDADGVLDALVKPSSRVSEALSECLDATHEEFHSAFRAALQTEDRCVVVAYPDEWPTYAISLVVASILGPIEPDRESPLGPAVNEVRTGSGLNHDQAWHTDSTPWGVPNRWTLLGMLQQDMRDRRETAILPITQVLRRCEASSTILETLQGALVDWRKNFSGLPPLFAPVLGPGCTRWIRPALESYLEETGTPVGQACTFFSDAVGRAEVWRETIVDHGRLLVFDNHAVLHRGPATNGPSCRTLLRVKVGGRHVA